MFIDGEMNNIDYVDVQRGIEIIIDFVPEFETILDHEGNPILDHLGNEVMGSTPI